ncbi:LuxR C-terminal-related transcriptional regulator [Arthrobacter sp. LjRoot14]|uniref:LuxR C-terminal-related transcriptional regulator n=1 Tax=Arthrobacter sp. LjRoot14 TaxID=3342265 RepID=UPI003ED0C0F1
MEQFASNPKLILIGLPITEGAMGLETVRAGIIDDHEAVRVGFALSAAREAPHKTPRITVMGAAPTVDVFLRAGTDICDVIALDLSLADGSQPGDNVAKLTAAGYKILVFTLGDNVWQIQDALSTGAMGVSLKSEPISETFAKLRRIAAGETIDSQELAAAIEVDADFVEANLSDRERECIALYAAGLGQYQVARRMGIAESTVKKNVDRIREKYEAAGRPASTKIDLYRRAVEDGILPPLLPLRKR